MAKQWQGLDQQEIPPVGFPVLKSPLEIFRGNSTVFLDEHLQPRRLKTGSERPVVCVLLDPGLMEILESQADIVSSEPVHNQPGGTELSLLQLKMNQGHRPLERVGFLFVPD